MTRDEWDGLLKQFKLAWPSSPLTDAQGDAYFAVLQDLDKGECSRAIVQLVTDGAETAPPPHRILRVAADQGAASTATAQVAPAVPRAKEVSPESSEEEPSWLRRHAKLLATGAIALAVGVGIGAGTALLSAPDADVAFAQGKGEGFSEGKSEGRAEGIDIGDARGFSRGKRVGYRSGLTDGRERGYREGTEAGRADVFDSLNGGPPSVGNWYLIRYGSNNTIESWFSAPFETDTCQALISNGDGSYTLRDYGFCSG